MTWPSANDAETIPPEVRIPPSRNPTKLGVKPTIHADIAATGTPHKEKTCPAKDQKFNKCGGDKHLSRACADTKVTSKDPLSLPTSEKKKPGHVILNRVAGMNGSIGHCTNPTTRDMGRHHHHSRQWIPSLSGRNRHTVGSEHCEPTFSEVPNRQSRGGERNTLTQHRYNTSACQFRRKNDDDEHRNLPRGVRSATVMLRPHQVRNFTSKLSKPTATTCQFRNPAAPKNQT